MSRHNKNNFWFFTRQFDQIYVSPSALVQEERLVNMSTQLLSYFLPGMRSVWMNLWLGYIGSSDSVGKVNLSSPYWFFFHWGIDSYKKSRTLLTWSSCRLKASLPIHHHDLIRLMFYVEKCILTVMIIAFSKFKFY